LQYRKQRKATAGAGVGGVATVIETDVETMKQGHVLQCFMCCNPL